MRKIKVNVASHVRDARYSALHGIPGVMAERLLRMMVPVIDMMVCIAALVIAVSI